MIVAPLISPSPSRRLPRSTVRGGRRRAALVAIAVCAALVDCRLSKPISEEQAAQLIRESKAFARPKYLRIPRQLTFTRSWYSRYGVEPLFTISELARVDAVLAVLKLQRMIRVDESIFGPGHGAMHLLVVTPTDIEGAALLSDEDPGTPLDEQEREDRRNERPYGYGLLRRDDLKRYPGWRIAVGTREFVQVDEIHNWKDANVELPVNELAIDFSWRWQPNELGDAFDSRSSTFESLPDTVQEAARTAGVRMNTSDLMHSRAFLHREGAEWKLRVIEWSFGRGNPM